MPRLFQFQHDVERGTSAALKLFSRNLPDDRKALSALCQNCRTVDARRDLIHEGDEPRYVHLILDGWACRYKSLPDGRRQIVSIFIPGDFCDLHVHLLKTMDHSIGAITPLKVAMIQPDDIDALTDQRSTVAKAMWCHELVSAAVQREWTLNIGQRSAYERLGHLLVELYLRMRAVDLGEFGRCDFPLTQNDLADATGLTSVHVNRTLQELRRDRLIELERKQLQILDLDRLMTVSMFNPNYLHLRPEEQRLDACG